MVEPEHITFAVYDLIKPVYFQKITESERYCVFSKMKKGILGVICKRWANPPSRGLGTPPLNKGGMVRARVEGRSPA